MVDGPVPVNRIGSSGFLYVSDITATPLATWAMSSHRIPLPSRCYLKHSVRAFSYLHYFASLLSFFSDAAQVH